MQWVTLGKTKGTIQKSKFDKDREKINKLLKLAVFDYPPEKVKQDEDCF